MALSANAVFDLQATLTSVLDLAVSTTPLAYRKTIPFTNGGGLNQATFMFSDQRTLAASASEDLDLAGVLLDPNGAVLTFASIKVMAFFCPATAAGDLTVTAKSVNGFSTWAGAAGNAIKVKPGGLIAMIAPGATGYAVTASTGDLLTVTNGDSVNPVTYDVIFLGD